MKVKLSDIVNRINGNVDRFATELEYYVGGEHFDSSELTISRYGLLKPNVEILGFKFHFAFQERDVLFMARNPHLRKAGMVTCSGLCSDASYILRSKDEDVITQEFLAIQLQTDHFWEYCESHKVGSVNFAINYKTLAAYEFELPPIETQKEISNKVWAAYRLKEAYKRLLVATDEMVKSQFLEMFGNPDTPIAKGHNLFTFASGKSMVKSELSNEYPYDCYGGNGITGKARDFLVANTTIVIGRVGEYCGCVHKTTEKSWITDNAIYVKSHSNKLLLDFAFHAFIIADFHRFATESGQPKITQEPLLSYEFPVPSIEEQEVFINIVRQADKSKYYEINET